jgi:hypothetical protein
MPLRASRVIALGLAAIIALTVASAALAQPQTNLNAKIKALTTGKTEYSGRVTSTTPECVKGRKIQVRVGERQIGNPKTDQEGRFLLTARTLKSGTMVTFKLKPDGDECIPLEIALAAP